MNFLTMLSAAIAMMSSPPSYSQGQRLTSSCAAQLLSRPAVACQALQQDLRLSPRQSRQIAAIRSRVNGRLSVLQRQLHQVRMKLAQPMHIRPRLLRRLHQQATALTWQIAQVKARGTAYIAAVLSPRQLRRCTALAQWSPHREVNPVRQPRTARHYRSSWQRGL